MNNSVYHIFIIIYASFMFIGCLSIAPSWVDNRPIDEEYFHGIGYGSFVASNNPKRLARDNAINEIGSQIKVNITSTMDIVVKDFNGSIDNAITSVMQSRVDLLLPELEFIGQYKGKDGIYYYVRLNKIKYKEAIDRLLENAKTTALNHIKNAEKNYNVGSFILVQKAWEEILPFHDEPIWVKYKGNKINLYSLIKSKANEYVNRLELKASTKLKKMRTYIDRDNRLSIEVSDRISNRLLSGIPLKIITPDGDRVIYSNEGGKVEYLFQSVNIPSTISIEYKFDHYKLYSDLDQSDLLLKLDPKTYSTIVKVVPAKAKIISIEKNLDIVLEQNIIEPAIKQSLSKKIEFVNKNPDMTITIDANTIKKSERISDNYPYFSYGNASMTFVDFNTSEEFYSANVNNVKGGDFSSQKIAGIRAYDAMVHELQSALYNSFNNH